VAANGKFSHPNSGTVSHIHFKVGTRPSKLHHVTGLQGPEVKRQGHVTYLIKKCNNSVLGDHINFILGG